MNNVKQQAHEILSGNRRALARAITLVESTRADHRSEAQELMRILSASERKAIRIGLSGTPGVGKSTFTESFGMMLLTEGLRVAVLAVDPTSVRSGGSILGDKTRMDLLSREANAYIRPSPSRTVLGGVARRTRETIALCEAAGYDVVIVETVGVGQSETMVAEMTDIFALLLAPAGGDELQGVKRGIMEIADIILVNKADGDLRPAALRTCADYSGALRLLRKRARDPEGFPKAMTVSALTGENMDAAWAEISELVKWREKSGVLADRRREQSALWFKSEIEEGLLARLRENAAVQALWATLEADVKAGTLAPEAAATQVLDMFVNIPRRIP